MPTCHKCGKEFPNRTIINGKRKLLSKRKYCLECSPWGLHNTRAIPDTLKVGSETCVCQYCGRTYSYHPKDRKGFTQKHCNSCGVNMRRFKLKLKSIQYKGKCCEKCGYARNASSLTFHHKDPSQKEFNLGGCHCLAWETIKKELDKCILVCNNCHGEIHNPDSELVFVGEEIYYKYNKYGPLV